MLRSSPAQAHKTLFALQHQSSIPPTPHLEKLGPMVTCKLSLQFPSLILRLRSRKPLGPEATQRATSQVHTPPSEESPSFAFGIVLGWGV